MKFYGMLVAAGSSSLWVSPSMIDTVWFWYLLFIFHCSFFYFISLLLTYIFNLIASFGRHCKSSVDITINFWCKYFKILLIYRKYLFVFAICFGLSRICYSINLKGHLCFDFRSFECWGFVKWRYFFKKLFKVVVVL